MIYKEPFLIVIDYFWSVKLKEVNYEIILPTVFSQICGLLFFQGKPNVLVTNLTSFSNSTVSVVGILTGLAIAVITVVAGSSDQKFAELKKRKEGRNIIGKKDITSYQYFLSLLSYTVVVGCFALLYNMFLPQIINDFSSLHLITYSFVFNAFLSLHIILVHIRNITNFYHILMSEE